jgi:hypothetical protein
MRTAPFRSIVYGTATRMGLEPANNLQLNQAAALVEYIQDRCQEAWEMAPWPEWTVSELRQYRATWSSATTYALGAEVYDATGNAYYRSLQAGNTNHAPPSSTTWWAKASDLDTYVALEQSWEATPIGVVWEVWADDPRTTPRPRPVSWWIGDNGIQVATDQSRVWVEFGRRPPAFTVVEWDALTAYVAGAVVLYGPSGECYAARAPSTGATPPSNSTLWQWQAFPWVLARHVKLAAIGDALREDENLTKAAAWDTQADKALEQALDRMGPQMRAAPSFSVNGR